MEHQHYLVTSRTTNKGRVGSSPKSLHLSASSTQMIRNFTEPSECARYWTENCSHVPEEASRQAVRRRDENKA